MKNLLNSKTNRYLFFTILTFVIIMIGSVNSASALSENDMRNPALLSSEGWKRVGYGGWGWDLKNKATVANLNYAETLFKKAVELDPQNANAYAGLARIIQIRGSSGRQFNKDVCKKAYELMENAPVKNANTFEMLYVRSELLLCLEDFDAAIRETEKLQEINNTCLSHNLRSMSYYEKYRQIKNTSDKDMALLEGTDYLECVQNRNLDTGLAFTNLTIMLHFTKDYDSIVEYFKSNMTTKPYSQWSYRNYVWVLLRRGTIADLNEAEKTIHKAKSILNIDMCPMQLYNDRGEKYYKLKQYDKAFDDYSKLLALSPYSVRRDRLTEVCSMFDDDRCLPIWQKRIKKYLDLGDCKSASEEFNIQYSLHQHAFEPMKEAVTQCKSKKK